MTTPVNPTITDVSEKGDGSAIVAQWAAVTESNTFGAVKFAEHAAKSIQVTGTLGTATLVLNGGNDGTNFAGLNTPQGSAISLTAAGLKGVQEQCAYYQPSASGGTGQSLTVSLLLVRPTPPRT